MATGQNPSVSVNRAPTNPPPIPAYGDKWVKRVYSACKEGAAGAEVDFLQSSFNIPGPYYVDKVQIWNLDITHKYGISASLQQGLISDLGTDSVIGNDFGNATSLPGVTFKVPLGHAKQVSNTGTGVVVKAGCVPPFDTKSGTYDYACHLTVWVSI